MNEILKLFTKEIKSFTKANWWIFIVYCVIMICARKQPPIDLANIFIVTSLHFVADIFIMMMFSAYHRSDYKQGSYFQIFSMLLFLALKIYIGCTSCKWHYLTADLIYILAAFKNYKLDVKKVDIKTINPFTTSLLSILIIGFLIHLEINSPFEIFKDASNYLTTAGIFLFAISLTFTGNESSRFTFSIIALSVMIIGAGWETFIAFSTNDIHGLELSYFLLPITVLVFNIRSWISADK